jgi:hypothetical protein
MFGGKSARGLYGLGMRKWQITLAGLVIPVAVYAETGSNIVDEAENAPVSTVVETILKKKRINFVYSNSRLGIGTNRPARIEIYVSKRARAGKKK